MIFDSHCHTRFSADSEMQAEDALRAAEALGLGLVFTEHLDLDFPGDVDYTFDFGAYWQAYAPLCGDRLRLGIEVGMTPATASERETLGTDVPFDLVIGSLHVLDDKDLYFAESYAGQTKEEAYHAYFAKLAEMVRTHAYIDVLGHIDYIARYAPFENPEISYGAFTEDIDAVLRAAVEADIVLELNTRRLGARRALKELVPVYTRYRALGGRYVTLGSDAHAADAIGANFRAAKELADAVGLGIVTFHGRRRELLQ